MQYNPGAQLDPSQMGGVSGGSRGGGIAVGGGASIIIIILALLFGIDPGALLGGSASGGGQATGGTNDRYAHCQTGADIAKDRECRFVAYTNSVQSYWSQALPGYEVTQTVPFTGAVNTGCGQASAQTGPFYCPADHNVYLDTAFLDKLLGQLGAQGGDAAEAYVIAHEYGHHVQNLTGVLNKVQQSQGDTGPTSAGVRSELQADCYAGVWFRHATDDPNGPIQGVTQDDLNRIADAAESVGDDHIQEQSSGRVNPEEWTHGSSAQRNRWLARGFQSGDPNQCNTFAANAPIQG